MDIARRTAFKGLLAKTLMLANMFAFAGKGTCGFDGEKTDSAVANAHSKQGYRKGWNPFKEEA